MEKINKIVAGNLENKEKNLKEEKKCQDIQNGIILQQKKEKQMLPEEKYLLN
jgi:hypothetical protein